MYIPVQKNNGKYAIYSLRIDKEMAYDCLKEIRTDNEREIGGSLYIDRNLSKIMTLIEDMCNPDFEQFCMALNMQSGLVINLEELVEDKESLETNDLTVLKTTNPSLYYLTNIINSDKSELVKEDGDHEIYAYLEKNEWMQEVAKRNSAYLVALDHASYETPKQYAIKRR